MKASVKSLTEGPMLARDPAGHRSGADLCRKSNQDQHGLAPECGGISDTGEKQWSGDDDCTAETGNDPDEYGSPVGSHGGP